MEKQILHGKALTDQVVGKKTFRLMFWTFFFFFLAALTNSAMCLDTGNLSAMARNNGTLAKRSIRVTLPSTGEMHRAGNCLLSLCSYTAPAALELQPSLASPGPESDFCWAESLKEWLVSSERQS